MAHRRLTLPAVWVLSGLGMVLAEIIQRAVLALGGVAHRADLPMAGVIVIVGYLAVFLLWTPAAFVGYEGARRTGNVASSVFGGLGGGLLGGLIMGLLDSVVRSVAPQAWALITYPYGPPAGPLVAPAVLLTASLVLFTFAGITGAYWAARLGHTRYRRHYDAGQSQGVAAE